MRIISLLTAFLTAVSPIQAQPLDNNFGKLPKIEFKQGSWVPMYLPDDHEDPTRRQKAFLAVKKMIAAGNIDTIWLEGFPNEISNEISEDRLRLMINEVIVRRDALLASVKDGTALTSPTFTMPVLYAPYMAQLEVRLRPFNALLIPPEKAKEMHQHLLDLIELLRFEQTTKNILHLRTPENDYRTFAPGLTYFEDLGNETLKDGKKIHLVGLEQSDHFLKWEKLYSAYIALMLIYNTRVYKENIRDLRAYADALAALDNNDPARSEAIANLRETLNSLEQSLNYFEDQAKVQISKMLPMWPPSVQKLWPQDQSSLRNFVLQEIVKITDIRSKDWAQSYQNTLKIRKDPCHDLIIGGSGHESVLIEEFKGKLNVLSAEALDLKQNAPH